MHKWKTNNMTQKITFQDFKIQSLVLINYKLQKLVHNTRKMNTICLQETNRVGQKVRAIGGYIL